MAKQNQTLNPGKTYRTVASMERAIAAAGIPDFFEGEVVQYHVACTPIGRFYPIFMGRVAITLGISHLGFICIA